MTEDEQVAQRIVSQHTCSGLRKNRTELANDITTALRTQREALEAQIADLNHDLEESEKHCREYHQ